MNNPPVVQVAVNVPSAAGVFDYHLAPEQIGRITPGHLVTVPFGSRTVQAVVLGFVSRSSVPETKPILELIDPLPVLTGAQINLARELAAATCSPVSQIVGLMLPPGVAQQADTLYMSTGKQIIPRSSEGRGALSPTQIRLLELIQKRGNLRGRQIDRHFRNVEWRKAAAALVRSGYLAGHSILPPASVRPKYVRTAQLSAAPEIAQDSFEDLGHTEQTLKRRQAVLQYLLREPGEVNVAWIYAETGCNLADLQELAEKELITLRETEIFRDPLAQSRDENSSLSAASLPELQLTAAQEAAVSQVLAAFSATKSDSASPYPIFLLHGVTGSGKTEVYLRAAAECLRRGQQAIILVPEIAMTPQMVQIFQRHFPGQVGLLHSRLSDGERYDTWRRARRGLIRVIIGPRSALFAPLPEVGLLVVDECHDGSYYQADPPFYSAVSAAQRYARVCRAVCILGSATPPVALRYQAIRRSQEGTAGRSNAEGSLLQLLELPERITGRTEGRSPRVQALPPVHVVDMRAELKSGNRGIFSFSLVQALGEVLENHEQAILFLNRRGTATYIFCRECGYAARCPNCETPLTYHSPAEKLSCHHCGYTRAALLVCPSCGSHQIRAYGLGSERVEREVIAHFPAARTLRWDFETTREKDAHAILLAHFAAQRADVLIGTQMLAKGLDLPSVTLVGIVLADVGLNLPDPYAAERTFDVLTQVAGRAGRSSLGGRVVLQTFQPEHYVLQAAASHDYPGFFAHELANRRRLGYPPFNRLVRMEYRHTGASQAEKEARRMAKYVEGSLRADQRTETDIIGPVPAFFARLNGLYRWQIVLRGPNPASLLQGLKLEGWRVEVDPVSLL